MTDRRGRGRSVDVTVPAPLKQKIDTDVLAAVWLMLPADAGGSVQWGDTGGGRFLETVTFQLPAAQARDRRAAQGEGLRAAQGARLRGLRL